jgi:alcohol dehydrogenase
MQQLFFVEPGRVEWREVPRPQLVDAEDVLVSPVAVATCDLDTGLIQGRAPFPGPFPLGHEGVGEVIEISSEVSTVAVGQRVIVPFQVSCGRCGRCRRGLTASCERVDLGAMYGLEPFGGPWGGFLSDVVRVPWADHMLVPLPDGVDPVAVASLSDNIPDAWRTVAPFVEDAPNASVLVVGGGTPSLPFYSIAIARALGVDRVDYLEVDGGSADRFEKAARCGASVIDSPQEVRPRSYTVTVCSSNEVDALNLALRATEPDGTCVVNTIFFQDNVPLPMFSMYTHGVRLVTSRVNARAVMPKALDLIVDGGFHPEAVTDAVVEWSDAADALVAEPRKLVIQRSN